MEVKLTKEADKLLTVMYREYLNKRKAGQPKSCAKEFEYDYLNSMEPFNAWPDGDFSETLRELASKYPPKILRNRTWKAVDGICDRKRQKNRT